MVKDFYRIFMSHYNSIVFFYSVIHFQDQLEYWTLKGESEETWSHYTDDHWSGYSKDFLNETLCNIILSGNKSEKTLS